MSTTLLPFLYHTRTLVAASVPSLSRTTVRAVSSRRDWHNPNEHDIPFEDTSRTPAPPKPTQHDKKRSTLTPDERKAFEGIFADIEASGKSPKDVGATVETNAEDDADIAFESEGQAPNGDTGDGNVTHTLRAILEDAGHNFERSSRLDPLSPLQQLQEPVTDRGKLVMRFPQPLREVAHQALHFLDAGPMDGKQHDPSRHTSIMSEIERAASTERAIAIENQRVRERTRVEALLSNAKTDLELWSVMEHNVFSMVDRLGIRDGTSDEDKMPRVAAASRKGKKGHKKKPSPDNLEAKKEIIKIHSKKEQAKAGKDANGATNFSMRVHGPLYPGFVLLGLQMLDTNFSRTSPLALSVLPRVKQLGLTSYVLGISTPFYNMLMKLYWQRYGDLGQVLNLLEETKVAGLYIDEDTLNLLKKIRETLQGAARDRESRFATALTFMPEYDTFVRERLGFWIKHSHRSMEDRQAMLGF